MKRNINGPNCAHFVSPNIMCQLNGGGRENAEPPATATSTAASSAYRLTATQWRRRPIITFTDTTIIPVLVHPLVVASLPSKLDDV